MNKPASFSDMKRVNKMSYNDFNRWVSSIYKSGYNDGLDTNNWVSDEDIFAILRSEGIGKERANRICDRIMEIGGESPWILEV